MATHIPTPKRVGTITVGGMLVNVVAVGFPDGVVLLARSFTVLLMIVLFVMFYTHRAEWVDYLRETKRRGRLMAQVLTVLFGLGFVAALTWFNWPEAIPQEKGAQSENGDAAKNDQLRGSTTGKLPPEQAPGLPKAVNPAPEPALPPRSIAGGRSYPAPPPPSSPATSPNPVQMEADRRAAVIRQLTQLYILSHDGISSRMMAGMELPPSGFLNQELERKGEKWRVQSVNDDKAVTYDVP